MKTLPLGLFANDLSSPRQMLIVCLALLLDINPTLANRQKAKKIVSKAESGQDLSPKDITVLKATINTIFNDLNHSVPPFTYFGHHPTDHSQLGVWIDLYALHKAENNGQITQLAGASWKGIKSNYILDMANAGIVLYRRRGKKEVWRINQ